MALTQGMTWTTSDGTVFDNYLDAQQYEQSAALLLALKTAAPATAVDIAAFIDGNADLVQSYLEARDAVVRRTAAEALQTERANAIAERKNNAVPAT